jgi:hypothetical protein
VTILLHERTRVLDEKPKKNNNYRFDW